MSGDRRYNEKKDVFVMADKALEVEANWRRPVSGDKIVNGAAIIF